MTNSSRPAARNGRPDSDREIGRRYRVYTPRAATRQLVGLGIPRPRAVAIVRRYLANLAAARGGAPPGGWQLRDEDLTAMVPRRLPVARNHPPMDCLGPRGAAGADDARRDELIRWHADAGPSRGDATSVRADPVRQDGAR